ncbi:NDP-hexose 2,3-dehydratase family protein [Streptomyces sp. NPDC059256]|uniref:NDP-hexose 2,3-dehydratase family protein n=1 Tax=Streptomyces sp. NPDC059256 TaxID=3346794 RepID=UPI00367DA239
MTALTATGPATAVGGDLGDIALRLGESVRERGADGGPLTGFRQWFEEFGARAYTRVRPAPLAELEGWRQDPDTGNLHHHSGGFFSVEGLSTSRPQGPVQHWTQPVIHQPEIGVLGLLVKEFDGVLRALVQAKVEPGNRNGLQLAPTVQATRSNYLRVHQGKPVPYLEFFREPWRHRQIADVRQSEQGSWFYRKRNRNMVVEAVGEVQLLDGFIWLTIGEIQELLAVEDTVNMDLRSVLSCLPLTGPGLDTVLRSDGSGFRGALVRSCATASGSRHPTGELLHWMTEMRTRTEVSARLLPLDRLSGWQRTPERISHESGEFFSVIGVDVTAGGREVAHWSQPMIRQHGRGVIALLVAEFDGVLHALMHARVEPGFLDVVELAPTVQCIPDSLAALPATARPEFLDTVLSAAPEQIRYDTVLSEEGGRFYHALNRYLIVEVAPTKIEHPDYRWTAVHQLTELLRHSHYLNIQARSLVACLHGLLERSGSTAGVEGS